MACVGGIWHDLQTWVEAVCKTLDEKVKKLVVWVIYKGGSENVDFDWGIEILTQALLGGVMRESRS